MKIVDGLPLPEYVYSLSQVFQMEIEEIDLDTAIKTRRVSGSLFGPIPPGAIIVDFGERLREDHRKYFDFSDPANPPKIFCLIEKNS